MADVYVTKTFKISKHGTASSYQRGCHCDDCVRVGRESKRQLDAERRKHPEDAPHGTRGGYSNWGCRCDLCKKVQAEYMKSWRARRAES